MKIDNSAEFKAMLVDIADSSIILGRPDTTKIELGMIWINQYIEEQWKKLKANPTNT